MPEPLKNIYNEAFITQLAEALSSVEPSFNQSDFVKNVFDKAWPNKELKERMRHIAVCIHSGLKGSFEDHVKVLIESISHLISLGIAENGFEYMFLPDYIEVYGQAHLETSIAAMEKITQFTSCEFAVRPFILAHPEKMIIQLFKWSKHPHPMVRRLSTEGCRPRLPWAMALPFLKRDPAPILPILENLKSDDSESVRRSVANNLNDIAKDHPDQVIDIAERWLGKSKETDWVVKHGCRTLLKQGHPEALKLFGLGEVKGVEIVDFKLKTPKISLGDYLEFSSLLVNKNDHKVHLRLEYAVYYVKANGTLSKKVYKISEKEYDAASSTLIERRQHFKPISTRKYHPGLHQIAMVVNGREFERHDFELTI